MYKAKRLQTKSSKFFNKIEYPNVFSVSLLYRMAKYVSEEHLHVSYNLYFYGSYI